MNFQKNILLPLVFCLICLFLLSACGGGGGGENILSYSLAINTAGQGEVTPAAGQFNDGTEVTLTATPSAGWVFSEWQGDVQSTDNPLTIAVGSDKNVTAVFVNPIVRVLLETSEGDMTLKLYSDKAPVTVENFLQYVREGFYDGTDSLGATIFHRVISGFVIQGGGFTELLTQKTTHDPIINESNNGLSNTRGTIAMARTSDPNSATAQFYINLVDNLSLNYANEAAPGYAVFGELENGFDVLDKIGAVATTASDIPQTTISIISAQILGE